jgi:Zn-dependent protease with chaperone function
MYLRLGLLLALATFLAWNALLSLLVAGLGRAVAGAASRLHPRSRARLLLALRLAPAALSTLFVLCLFAPSYVLFEPEATGEAAGVRLVSVAIGSLLLWSLALSRLALSRRATQRLVRHWLESAERRSDLGTEVYRIVDPFPVVSVVGSRRPRVFVAGQVLDALGPSELAVVLKHEEAHMLSKDNLKRQAVQSAPDILGLLPAGRWLQGEWERASEVAADDAAVGGVGLRAIDLSSALITVARLVPEGARITGGVSALHDGDAIDYRIRHLLQGNLGSERAERRLGPKVVSSLFVLGALSIAATHAPVLGFVHELTEILVRLLR